jgi:preprotein translocase subunit SecG
MMTELIDMPLIQPLLGAIGLSILKLLLFFSSLWLIFLILIQRGKGGGLTAAFGGGGGDSAFGAKAGDAFTKITIISSLVWITLCMVTIARYNPPEQPENPYAAQADQELPPNERASLGGGASMAPADGEDEAAGAADGDASESGSTESDTTEGGTAEGEADESSDQ